MQHSVHSPVRVGLLLESLEIPAWNFELLEQMLVADWVDVALLVIKAGAQEETRTFPQRLKSARRNFLYAIYTRLDERVLGAKCQPNAFELKSVESLVADVPQIHVSPRETKFSDYFAKEDVRQVRDANVDVLLRWGFRILRGGILKAPKYGIWSFHHGDNRVNRGSLPGFWEVMEGVRTTGSVLQILSEQLDGGTTLARHVGGTEMKSVAKNMHNLYWKTAPLLITSLKNLHDDRAGFESKYMFGKEQCKVNSPNSRDSSTDNSLATSQDNANASLSDCQCGGSKSSQSLAKPFEPYCHPLRTQPSNWQMLRGLSRMAARLFAEKARHVFHYDQWFLAYHIAKTGNGQAFYQYKTILPPKDCFWADPFPVERDGRYFVFFEEYIYKTDRAHLSVLEIDQDGNWSNPTQIIQRPYHLSYPFVFEFEGTTYMIPETGENRSIELYRCTDFPHGWEFDRELMPNVNAVDATLHEHDGKWWLFTSIVDKDLHNRDCLHLFFADTPFGPWQSHPENPLQCDIRNARPAGKLFTKGGVLYRPAQDCSTRYGYAIKVNEVLEFNERRYRERVVTEITPDWEPLLLGTHTINFCGNLTVIDGERLRQRLL